MKAKTVRSLDPIDNLSPELFDLVFQHLSPKELMCSSFVSHAWHEEIGNCQNMRRIKVFIYHHEQEELNVSLERLFSSQRKYRNVSVNLSTMMFDEKVERSARESNARYESVKFSDAKLYDSLWPLEVIDSTVRDLSLCNIQCNLECGTFKRLRFPRLRHLTLYKNAESIDNLFGECHSLLSFCYTERSDVQNTTLVGKVLLNNPTTKVLNLCIQKCSSSLQKIVAKCKFRLEKFAFYAHRLHSRMPPENQNLLCAFLESQKDCLEILSIDQWCGTNALTLIFNIATLSNLSFNIRHKGETVNHIQLAQNASITRVDISEMLEADSPVLAHVLRAVPNLVIYKTCLMQFADMMVLERHCPRLRELYVEEFSALALPPHANSFAQLTTFKSLDVCTELAMLILAKDEEKRSHFERLVLQCCPSAHVS